MKKRYVLIPLLLLAVVILAITVFAAGSEIPQASTTYREISYTYIPGGLNKSITCSSAFPYADVMLLGDANEFSGEIAKASVALASVAYDRDRVNSTLSAMGYTAYDNTEIYDRLNNMTIWDNDYVAYTIAYRDVQYNGENYRIYCVPVKGTGSNAEWFSNYNLGTGTEHEGFRIAAESVYHDLIMRMAYDGGDQFDMDHRVIWLTGHSRGAAVSNLVAGWLLEKGIAKPERVFGYTFACPSNSKNADTSLTNIYNFNNPNDLVPLMPIEEWGYKRYGVSVESMSDLITDDVDFQFKRIAGVTIDKRMRSTWQSMMHALAPTQNDFYGEQALFELLAWVQGGKTQVSLTDLLIHLGFENRGVIIDKLAGATGIPGLKTILRTLTNDYGQESTSAEQMVADTEGMTAESVARYLSEHSSAVQSLAKAAGVDVVDLESLKTASQVVNRTLIAAQDISDIIESGDDLFFDANGNMLTAINHCHTALTYTAWMSAAYYGYNGWYGYPNACSITIDNTKLVGSYCFYNCSGLTSVTIANGVESLGNYAFQNCTDMTKLVIPDSVELLGISAFKGCNKLQSLTIPIDLEVIKVYDHHPHDHYLIFGGCNYISELHYTVGKTGRQPDRQFDGVWSYTYGLEQQAYDTLTTVIYDEGITHIGNYAFFPSGGSFNDITQISLPSTLESIGSNAFCGLTNIAEIEIPDNVTQIGESCFSGCIGLKSLPISSSMETIPNSCYSGCTGLTSVTIPETIKNVGYRAFFNCTGITEVVIPDTLESLGTYAFSGCYRLQSLTIPIDLEVIKISYLGVSNLCFGGCNNISELHYTVGQTGRQPDRQFDGVWSYNNGVEQRACDALTTVTYEEGITRIGNNAFYPGSGSFNQITQISLPSTLESIGRNAFCGLTNLNRIEFAHCLKTVDSDAFNSVTALKDVYFSGSQYDWNTIVIRSNNAPLQNAAFHEYSTIYAAITAHPADRELPTGYLARFSVKTTGDGVAYQWQFSDDGGETWQASGSNTSSVSCTVCEETDGRLYRCIVTDKLGRPIVSRSASLTLNDAFVCTHTETELRDVVDATCTEEGFSGDVYCAVCGEKLEDGSVTPALDHNETTLSGAVEPTCTEDGYTGDTVCVFCGELMESGSAIPALGHSWNEGVVTLEPTGSAEGVKTFTCTVCGATTTESIPRLDNPFVDVPKGKFYYDPVLWAISQDPQITTGVDSTHFEPDRICTRAHVVTFLWRANGCPEPTNTTNTFKDVPNGKYYTKAVLWAAEQGITTGYSDGTFRPDDECTRGQVVTFLWRAKGQPIPASMSNPFTDVPNGKYYTNAVLWALENGITQGRTSTTFGPEDSCTRGHVVTFLYRAYAE